MKGDMRKLRQEMTKSVSMNKKGLDSGAVLQTISVIILIVVLGFVAISLAKGVVSIRDTFTVGSTEFNLANDTLTGIAEVGNNMQTLIIIAVVVLIVALVLSIFSVLRVKGGR